MFSSAVVAALLVNPDYANHPGTMGHGIVNPVAYETVGDYMKGKPKENFKRPGSKKLRVGWRSIPGVTCKAKPAARSQLEGAGFDVSVRPG